MRAGLKFYGPLILISLISLIYLIFFFYYDWHISEYMTANEAFKAIFSRNPRWVTWGICAVGPGLIIGFIIAIGLLLASSDEEFFNGFVEDFLSLSAQKAFPMSLRGVSIFIVFVIVGTILINRGNLGLGIRDGLEVIAIFVWTIFLITTLVMLPPLLINIFHRRLHNLLWRIMSKDDDSSKLC